MKKGFLTWLQESKADVVCLQETKAQASQIPVLEFASAGYLCYSLSAQKKGYSGVAILTKKEPQSKVLGMGMEKYDAEGRMIRIDFSSFSVASIYHPAGISGEVRQNFKMQWLSDFQIYTKELQKQIPNLILCGDYNIAHEEIDIHDPKGNANHSGFLPEERMWMTDFLGSGFIDSFRYTHPEEKDAYSWWSYRTNSRNNNKGWRLDYCMVSDAMKNKIIDAGIVPSAMQSDHCPVWVEINE